MNVDIVKNMDPYQANMLLILERIARALEKLVENDNDC